MIYRIKDFILHNWDVVRVFWKALWRTDAITAVGIFGLMFSALWVGEASDLTIGGMAAICCLPFAIVGFRFFIGTVVFVFSLVVLKASLGISVFLLAEFGYERALMLAGHVAAGFGIISQISAMDQEAIESLSIVLGKISIFGLMLGMAFRGMLLEKRPL